MLPKARKDGLVVQEVGDELLVYDVQRARAHRLNQATALVWSKCDGQTTLREVTALMQDTLHRSADEKLVRLAVKQLHKAKLVEPPTAGYAGDGITRRDVFKRVAAVGARCLLLPVIMSIPMALAPIPAFADACSGTGGSCSGTCADSTATCKSISKSGVCGCG